MQPLNLLEAEYIAHQLATELLSYTQEPIPPFGTRYPHKLESCLEQPFQTFGDQDLYPGLHRKAALLFYLVIKNHPFRNGNKRMALTLTLTFLFMNGQFLEIPTDQLYDLALTVAADDSIATIDDVTDSLTVLFQEHSVGRDHEKQ